MAGLLQKKEKLLWSQTSHFPFSIAIDFYIPYGDATTCCCRWQKKRDQQKCTTLIKAGLSILEDEDAKDADCSEVALLFSLLPEGRMSEVEAAVGSIPVKIQSTICIQLITGRLLTHRLQ